jgi:hypothetical protein
MPDISRDQDENSELRNDPALRNLTEAVKVGYAQGGERGLSKALFAKAESCDPSTDLPRAWRAYNCIRLGKDQEALQLLEEASENHDPNLDDWFSPGVLPQWKAIEDEPRFQALLKKNGFPSTSPPAPTNSVPGSAVAQLRPTADKQ